MQRRSKPRVVLGKHPRQPHRGWRGTLNLEEKRPGGYIIFLMRRLEKRMQGTDKKYVTI